VRRVHGGSHSVAASPEDQRTWDRQRGCPCHHSTGCEDVESESREVYWERISYSAEPEERDWLNPYHMKVNKCRESKET